MTLVPHVPEPPCPPALPFRRRLTPLGLGCRPTAIFLWKNHWASRSLSFTFKARVSYFKGRSTPKWKRTPCTCVCSLEGPTCPRVTPGPAAEIKQAGDANGLYLVTVPEPEGQALRVIRVLLSLAAPVWCQVEAPPRGSEAASGPRASEPTEPSAPLPNSTHRNQNPPFKQRS